MKRHHDIQIQVARKAGISKGHIVLDAGTGPAALLAVCLAGLVGEEGSVIAVDYEKGYIPKIRDAISKSEFPERISYLVGDLRYIPIRDHSLDAQEPIRLTKRGILGHIEASLAHEAFALGSNDVV